MKLIRQINNIKIYQNSDGVIITKAPDGRILEEFKSKKKLEKAIFWCYNVWDFTKHNRRLKSDN